MSTKPIRRSGETAESFNRRLTAWHIDNSNDLGSVLTRAFFGGSGPTGAPVTPSQRGGQGGRRRFNRPNPQTGSSQSRYVDPTKEPALAARLADEARIEADKDREMLKRFNEENKKRREQEKREQEKREQEEVSLDPNPSTQKGSGGQMSKLSYITTPKGHVFEPRDLPSEIEGYYKSPFDSVSLPDAYADWGPSSPERQVEIDKWESGEILPEVSTDDDSFVLPTGEGGVGLNETDRVLAKQNGPLKATKNKDGTWDFSRDYGEDSQWYDPKIDYDRRRAFLDAPDGQTGYKRALATQGVIRRGNMDFVQDEDGKEYAINSRDVMNGNKTVGAILDELTGVSTEGGVVDEHPLQEPLALKPEELNLATLPVDFGEDDDGDDQLDYYSYL